MSNSIAVFGYDFINNIGIYGYGIAAIIPEVVQKGLELQITIKDGLKLLIQHG